MKHKKVTWKPRGIEQRMAGHCHYSDTQIKAIITVTRREPEGGRTTFKKHLESLAELYFIKNNKAERPRTKEINLCFISISRAAARLLKSLQVHDEWKEMEQVPLPDALWKLFKHRAEEHAKSIGGFSNLPKLTWPDLNAPPGETFDDYQGDSKIKEIIEGVEMLQQWSSSIAKSPVSKAAFTYPGVRRQNNLDELGFRIAESLAHLG